MQPFTHAQVETDATVVYAVVFNGASGNAPINGVSLGGRAFTKIKSAEQTVNASLDVYRLVAPPVGAQTVAVTHSKLGYDPVRVSVFTVRGANTTTPNGTVTEVNIMPSTAYATKTVRSCRAATGSRSRRGGLGDVLNGTGITSTAGSRRSRQRRGCRRAVGVLGSRPGAASVVTPTTSRPTIGTLGIPDLIHGERRERSAAAAPPPPPTTGNARGERRIHDILDYDIAQFRRTHRITCGGRLRAAMEQLFYTNLTQIFDATRNGEPGAARMTFLSPLPGGYAQAYSTGVGHWPSNTGSIDLTFTIKLSSNWDNNGGGNTTTDQAVLLRRYTRRTIIS